MTALKRTRPVLGLGLAAVLLAAVVGCGGGSDDDAPEAGDTPSETPAESPTGEDAVEGQPAPEPDLEGIPDVVAEVNGEEVTRDEFVDTYTAQLEQAQAQAQAGGEAPDEDALKEQTLERMVDTELLLQEADSRGLSASEQDVEDELTSLAEQNQLGSAEEFIAALEEQGATEEQVRTQIETQVLVERLVEDEAGPIEPTEKELRTLYNEVKQQQAGQQGAQPLPPFKQVRDQVEEQAVGQEQGRIATQLVEDLRADAEITTNL